MMNKNRKILFVIGNRAHYARVKPILKFLPKDKVDYKIVVFESATLVEYGNVKDQIINYSGVKKVTEIYTNVSGGNLISMTKSTGLAIMEFTTVFSNNKPDAVVVIADRYEALSAAISARYMNIPLVHVQGGEISGSIDDSIRHAITKLANIHLVTNKECAKRVEKMGENLNSIYVTGCPTLDICSSLSIKDPKLVFQGHKGVHSPRFVLNDDYIIVSYHPVTTEYENSNNNFKVLLETINNLNIQTIWLYPNIDAGNEILKKQIIDFKANDKKGLIRFFKHFSIEEYMVLLKNAKCIVGNSSVGIRESSYFGTPSVTIGSRQQSRMRGENVIESKMKNKELQKKYYTR